MKKLLAVLLLLFAPSAWATTTVTGKIVNLGTQSLTSNAFVRFWLRGCQGTQPRVNGVALLGLSSAGTFYQDFAADSNGNIAGTVYSTRSITGTGNGEIECPSSVFTATWYGLQLFINGKGGPETPIHAKNGSTLNVTNVTPLSANPVITAPTGDTVYLRLDGGNSPVTGPITFSTSLTVSGTATFQQIGNIKLANASTAGADCGAKINTQDVALGATAGEIWVDQTCGTTWTTAVSIASSHILRFIQGGTYTTNTITVANWGGIIGSPSSVQFVASQANTILRQANGTNGNPYIHGAGSNILFRDFAIDGNGSNNATGGTDIDCLGSRCQFQSVSAINSPSHGLRLGDGTCCQNRGSGAKISNSHFVGNTGSGVFLNFTTDVWIVETELDNNTRYGLEGVGIATPRIIGNDVGGNALGGILISGATAFQSNGSIIIGNEFKNNLGIDLDIESDTGTPHANLATISANSFQGLGGAAAANTFAAIRSNGGGGNAITGNMVNTVTPSYKYCINIAEPAGGQELADQLVGNQCTGSFGTGSITTTASTHYGLNFLSGTANQTDNIIVGTSVQHDTGTQAASGFVRISTGDTLCWRNNANNADVCISKNASDQFVLGGSLLNATLVTPTINGGSINPVNLLLNATAPTIAGAGCGGTVAAISAPNGTASFNIFTGTAPTSGGCTITMPAATTDWHCEANHVSAISTTNFIIQQTGALSTTSVTLQLFSDVAAATAPTASDTWRTTCTAN